MQWLALFLNAPWTVLGMIMALQSGPRRLDWRARPLAVIVHVRSFWWLTLLRPRHTGVRGVAYGNIVLLGNTLPHDLEHELVHVEQYQRLPLVQPLFYLFEELRHGYHHNKYEAEAYRRAGNPYIEK